MRKTTAKSKQTKNKTRKCGKRGGGKKQSSKQKQQGQTQGQKQGQTQGQQQSSKKRQPNCSPIPIGDRNNKLNKKTCYSMDDLTRLKVAWNKRNPTNLITNTSQSELIDELTNKFAKTCSNEQCWYKQFADVNELKGVSELFAPTSPASWKTNPNEWLSSSDIEDVMKQYSKIYKCFQFYGPAPIDFDKVINGTCVTNSLCNINIKQLMESGKFKIGISLNTDPHNKGGEHWISIFINIKRGIIFFFDSSGEKAPKQVVALSDRIIKQGLALNPPIKFKFDQNYPKQHQYTTSECGMYSLYFIVSMLEDKLTQRYLKTRVITDTHMQKLRKIYYNESV
jgi:hypothetical protein